MKRMLPLLVLVIAGATHAQPGYWLDSDGEHVRDGDGDCVRTGTWSKEKATAECDPDLVATPRAEPEPAPAPAPPPPRAPRLHEVTLSAGATFAIGKSELSDDGKRELDILAAQIKEMGDNVSVITVSGHTDNTGSAALNQRLSKERAESVKAYLVSKDIEADKIETDGHGFDMPIADNSTAQGRAQNRRVEIAVDGAITQ